MSSAVSFTPLHERITRGAPWQGLRRPLRSEPVEHVLWIGGPPGAGKTSIARRIAAEHDLRVYHADAHTWVHYDRALTRGFPATARWEALTPDERWVTTAPEEMAAHSLELNADRFRLMLEDLRGFPATPLLVAEGTPLLPWLVAEVLASREHAVWLLPTPQLERELLAARPTTSFDATSDPSRAAENRLRRDLLVAAAIERDARERGLGLLPVDGSCDLAAMRETVAERLAPVLARGPRATTVEARRALRREENGRHLRQLLTYLARVPEAGRPETVEYAFSCECGGSGCVAVVPTAVARYEAAARDAGRPLVHPSHRA
jgi:hypothetical protein